MNLVRMFCKMLITCIAHFFRVVYVLIVYIGKSSKMKIRQPSTVIRQRITFIGQPK